MNFALSSQVSATQLLQWAKWVYGDPLTLTSRLSTKLAPADSLSEEDEAALYLDWQTRDTEVGYQLLEQQRSTLTDCLSAYSVSMMERRRNLALVKVRLDSLEQINLAEPNPALRYSSKVLKTTRREYNRALRELQYLKRFFVSMGALDQLLGSGIPTGQQWAGDLSEQRFRLLGQAGRGQLRVAAFRRRFPQADYKLPELTTMGLLTGLLVGQAAMSPSGTPADILVEPDVARYLLHCLESISLLALTIQNDGDLTFSEEGWPGVMELLRAIVELFYFCNFELPHANSHLLIDPDTPGKLLVFRDEQQQWEPLDEQTGDRLRREASEAARLLCLHPPLLDCQQTESIDKLLKRAKDLPRVNAGKYFEPYLTAGLARFEVSEIVSNKFHVAHSFLGRLLERVLEQSPPLSKRFTSELGGPVETLIAMAMLDQRVLAVNGTPNWSDNERFRWLVRFWKTMGKRRPSSLLGKHYSKEINRICELLGESSPERSSLLSIQLTTLFTRTSGSLLNRIEGGEGGEQMEDLLSGLALTDRVRVVSLLNVSWEFADQFLSPLQAAMDPRDFETVLANVHASIASKEGEIALCFNKKWMQANKTIWRLLRMAAPHAWHFWTVLANKPGWSAASEQMAPEEALGLMLRVFGDLVRLKLLFEVCSPRTSESQQVESETAARALLGALSRALMIGGLVSEAVAETFSCYYNQSALHDAALAFAGSFISYLDRMMSDLEAIDENRPLQTLLAAVIEFLQLHFPGTKSSTADATASEQLTTITLGGPSAACLELSENEVLVSKEGTVIRLQRDEWIELARRIKAGIFADLE